MSMLSRPWIRKLGTLFWLQWKLTTAVFRSRRSRHMGAALRLALSVVQLLFSVPMVVGLSIGAAIGFAMVTPQAAFELAIVANTFMALIWMLAPGTYSSQMLERFEMSRLFVHPVHPRTIVVGSTLISLVTMTAIWTVPLLLGEIVGLAWHAPAALPLFFLGAVPLFLFLALLGRIVDDLFDLIADDRRLRALVLGLISVPFMLMGFAQFGLQLLTDDFSRAPAFLQHVIDVERLAQAETFSAFVEILQPSRWLLWLPPGWVTAGMAYATTGMWGRAFAFLGLSALTVAALLALHAAVTLRLMRGAAITAGTATVRRRLRLRLPLSPALSALLEKDLHYLWRSPLPRRIMFGVLMMAVFVSLSLSRIPAGVLTDAGPPIIIAIVTFILVMANMSLNIAFTANYFGAVDREGLGSVLTTGVDRRLIILSANLAVLLLSAIAYGVHIVISLALLHALSWFPLLFLMVLCMQVSCVPAYTLAAVLAPYRMKIEVGMRQQRGNAWGMLAWAVASLPVLLLILLPNFLCPALLWVTVPLSVLYAVGVYVITLKPMAQLMMRRESAIFEAITSD